VKIKCPWCGANGDDDEPLSPGLEDTIARFGGSYVVPPHTAYTFEKRGEWGGRDVRKCLSCGNGFTVGGFGDPQKIETEAWEEHSAFWAQHKADQEEGMQARRDLVERDDSP
jgi:hypothetical protein